MVATVPAMGACLLEICDNPPYQCSSHLNRRLSPTLVSGRQARAAATRDLGGHAMHDNPTPAPRGASYDSSGPAVVIHDLTVNHPAVSSEAARWSTGQRGPAVGADALIDVDLSVFVTQAMAVGAQAIAAAGGVQDTYNLEQPVSYTHLRAHETDSYL